jgi:glycerol kinase
MEKKYVASIDQGTSSTRFMIFDRDCNVKGKSQMEHTQFYPAPGQVEHDPLEIWARTKDVIQEALRDAKINFSAIASLGITNQRETTVVWNKSVLFAILSTINSLSKLMHAIGKPVSHIIMRLCGMMVAPVIYALVWSLMVEKTDLGSRLDSQ